TRGRPVDGRRRRQAGNTAQGVCAAVVVKIVVTDLCLPATREMRLGALAVGVVLVMSRLGRSLIVDTAGHAIRAVARIVGYVAEQAIVFVGIRPVVDGGGIP